MSSSALRTRQFYATNASSYEQRAVRLGMQGEQLTEAQWVEAVACQVEADVNRVMARVWAKVSSRLGDPAAEFFATMAQLMERVAPLAVAEDVSVVTAFAQLRDAWTDALDPHNVLVTFGALNHFADAPAIDFTLVASQLTHGATVNDWVDGVRASAVEPGTYDAVVSALWVYLTSVSQATGDEALARVQMRMNMITGEVRSADLTELLGRTELVLGPVEWTRFCLVLQDFGFTLSFAPS
ncbi:hypothetical protein V5R04_06690 [Jonesiaceae bacterium BS-20]|uniref:Uncharacterized protein n=1 Tax=Jonesiaceae bacterium BS-20 TaxID=3120821 RepID=A0AAU7E0K1_9MICO